MHNTANPLALPLGLLIFSFVTHSVLLVPFINLLYKLKFIRAEQATRDAFNKPTPIFDKFHHHKQGTPVGGGLLIILLVSFLFIIIFPLMKYLGVNITHVYPIKDEINILFFTFISFGLLGLYDDFMKFFKFESTGFFGLRLRHKFFIQWALALIISLLLYFNLSIDIFYLPFIGVFRIGIWAIPLFAFIIVSFTNAVNITDGLDGLSGGLLMIAIFAFWILSGTILDTPLSFFLTLWLGGIIAFLYFNIFPARILLGDVGSLAFGATLAVVGILLGKVMALVIIGAIFIFEITSSLLQLLSKRFLHKKLFTVAPFHLWLQNTGWEEPKIVMRAWLAGIILAIVGVWMAMV